MNRRELLKFSLLSPLLGLFKKKEPIPLNRIYRQEYLLYTGQVPDDENGILFSVPDGERCIIKQVEFIRDKVNVYGYITSI